MMNSNKPGNETAHETSGDEKHQRCGRGRWIKFPFIIAAVILVKSAVVFFLWNNLVPDLFHGPELSYAHALELIILAKLLVGGFGGGFKGFRGGRHGHFGGPFGHHHGHHHEHHHGHDHHSGHGEHRWDGLSAEEREALREMIRERGER